MLNSIVLSGRRLTISAPALAAGSAEPANLLIFHDGQNLSAWRLVETISELVAAGEIAPTIIAAIDHAGERRIREFGYGAAGYARFVARDVVPYMRDHYPVGRERASTWMAGSSMGALVSLHIAALYPDIFGRLFVLSPSVWWNRRAILRVIKRPGILSGLLALRSLGGGARSKGIRDDIDIWLSIGLNEGATALSDARRLRDTLTEIRHGDASRLRYYEDPLGEHAEDSWARQIAMALPRRPLPL